jgi:hypothetical protein
MSVQAPVAGSFFCHCGLGSLTGYPTAFDLKVTLSPAAYSVSAGSGSMTVNRGVFVRVIDTVARFVVLLIAVVVTVKASFGSVQEAPIGNV